MLSRNLPWLLLALCLPRQSAALQIEPLSDGTAGAQALAERLAGSGVKVSNATLQGLPAAAGTFSGGRDAVGFDSGIVLGTGKIAALARPNKATSTSTELGLGGDPQIDAIAGNRSFDATSLSFDMVPSEDALVFRYVFGSEEYNEYVNASVNDAFGFFVDGENCAANAGHPVSVNTINGGNPLGKHATNSALYRNNDDQSGSAPFPIELDGLTVVLTCVARVRAGEVNRIRLVIADVQDARLDSAVFVETGSMRSRPMQEVKHLRGDPSGILTAKRQQTEAPPPPVPPPPKPAGIVVKSDPILMLKPTGERAGIIFAGTLDLAGIHPTGATGVDLSTNLARFGNRLQLEFGGVWRTLDGDALRIALEPEGERMLPVRLASSRCADAIAADEKLFLELSGVGPDGQPLTRSMPLSVAVSGHGWLDCLWPYLASLAGLSMLGFFFYGWWSPARFPRTVTVVLSPEPDLDEGTPVPIRGVRGSGSGFYRDARVYVCGDFKLRSHTGGEAIARLRAEGAGVRIRAAMPGMVKRRDADGDWAELAADEEPMRLGSLYCNDRETLFFAVRYRCAP